MAAEEDDRMEAVDGESVDRHVNVLVPSGNRLTYVVEEGLTVDGLIQRCAADASLEGNFSAMYGGKVLRGNEPVGSLDTLDEFTVHMFKRAAPVSLPVGDPSDLRGFDRLMRMGYSRHQVSRLRRRFHTARGSPRETQAQRVEAEDEWLPMLVQLDGQVDLPGAPRAAAEPVAAQPFANEGMGQQVGDEAGGHLAWWVKALIGVILGIVFGGVSLVFLVIGHGDIPFLVGLAAGALLHYLPGLLTST